MLGAPSFSQPYIYLYNLHTPTTSTKNSFLYFSQFPLFLPISPLFVDKIILAIPTNTPFYYSTTVFHFPAFYIQSSQKSTPKTFSLPQALVQFRLSQRTRELGSLVRTDTVLISPFFLKAWKTITGLTIADSLSLRLKKWYIESSSLWWRCLQSEWQIIQSTFSHTLNPLSLLPYPTNTITRTLIPKETSSVTWFSS